jgi:hypothetical protein
MKLKPQQEHSKLWFKLEKGVTEHQQRMYDARNSKPMHEASLHHRWHKGRPKAGWKVDVKNEVRKMGMTNWIKTEEKRTGMDGEE